MKKIHAGNIFAWASPKRNNLKVEEEQDHTERSSGAARTSQGYQMTDTGSLSNGIQGTGID